MAIKIIYVYAAFAMIAVCGTLNLSASAQTPTVKPSPTSPVAATGSQNNSTSPDTSDLAITAHVTARELTFETVPNPTVEFNGKPQRITEWNAVRENLPRPVQPGVTYRNVGVRLKITSVFADIDRIVAEALGEVPMTEDKPETNTNQSPAKSPSATSSPVTDRKPR